MHALIYTANAQKLKCAASALAKGALPTICAAKTSTLHPIRARTACTKTCCLTALRVNFMELFAPNQTGVGTDAEQSNQNLLLSETARAIARPQLEILIDDLQCRHGSSTGSINEEELFYMQTRCLNHDEAMHLAVDGFVREISGYFEKELLDALGIEMCLESLLQKRNSQ